jgi:hypothetical protein
MTSEPRFSPGLVKQSVLCLLFTGFLIIVIVSGVASARDKPAWIELRSPNFIVVTNAGEGQARRTAYQFEMIRKVFRVHFGHEPESVEQPVMILAAKDENTLKALLPSFGRKRERAIRRDSIWAAMMRTISHFD